MSVVIVVLRLLCCLLLSSTRVVDCKIEVHRRTSFLPSFVSFFLSFPLLLLFVLVWVILSQLKSFFFGLIFSCFSRFFVRETDGVPLFLNGFVEELRTALAAPREPHFQARTVYRISEYLTSQFSHAYSRLGICHQHFGPSINALVECLTSYKITFYQTYFLPYCLCFMHLTFETYELLSELLLIKELVTA